MNKKAVAGALVFLLIAGCEKSNDPAGEVSSINLSVGSAWTYQWQVEQYSSSGQLEWDTTSQFIVVVSAVNQSVGPYQGLTLLEARDREDPSGTTEIWYSQTNDRLTEVAYRSAENTPIVFPKGNGTLPMTISAPAPVSPFVQPYALQWGMPPSARSDSIQIRTDPRVVYVYPLAGGNSWVSFTSPFLQERTVEGYEEIVAPAGRYYSARIRTTLPAIAPDLDWIDFVSSQGLVKRILDSWVGVGDPSGNPVADSLRIVESMELLAH